MYSNCQYQVFVLSSSPRNSRQYFVKAVRINSPKCSFLGLHDDLIVRTSSQRKKSQQYVVLYTEWSCTLVFRILGIFWNLWPEINCWVSLTKVFLEPVSFVSTADTFVTNGWQIGQPSLTTLTMNGFTKNAKHGFNSWKWSNLAWNSALVLQFIVEFFHFVVLRLPLREKHAFSFWHLENDNAFDNMCFWKNGIFFWELK